MEREYKMTKGIFEKNHKPKDIEKMLYERNKTTIRWEMAYTITL